MSIVKKATLFSFEAEGLQYPLCNMRFVQVAIDEYLVIFFEVVIYDPSTWIVAVIVADFQRVEEGKAGHIAIEEA